MKKIMTRNRALAMALMLMLTMLAGCGGSNSKPADDNAAKQEPAVSAPAKDADDSEDADTGSGSKEIGVIFCDLNNPVFVVMKNAIEEKISELGYTATILNSEGSSETELQNVQNLVSKNVAAILVLANDSDTSVNTIKIANDAGIPIVGFNRPIYNEDSDAELVTQVITDNVSGGEIAGKLAIELLEGVENPKVAILRGTLGVASDKERYEGFMSAIAGSALEDAIVAEQSGNYNTQDGFATMQNIIQAQPELDLVYSENDTMAVGVMSALEGAQMEDVKIIGFDGSEEVVEYIVEGKIQATVAQKFKTMGTTAVEYAIKAIEGEAEDIPERVLVDTELVTGENADGYVGK